MLVVPLMAAIARQTVEDAWRRYEELTAMGFRWVGGWGAYDCRHSPAGGGAGGASAARQRIGELGAMMIVGSSVDRSTRAMTTAIALEGPARATCPWRWRWG